MDVVIAGGHGQIARRLGRLLAARGDRVRGIVRNPDHVADLEADGAEAVVLDMEQAGDEELAEALAGADAVVFAAGAGPGSGPERKQTVDLGAAVKCVEAARELGVDRFVIVSSIGMQDIERSGSMRVYLEAKRAADDAVKASGLSWTVVKPGSLNNDPGTGEVEIPATLGHTGPVTRDDVALVLYHVLLAPNAIHKEFELFSGDVPVEVAVQSL
jgi:uncharacterized protein YbjT (DUF2867 family)